MKRPRILTLGSSLLVLCPVVGLAGDGVVALQTADASCRTTTTPPPIYVNCGNGTVTDNRTGLVWLQNANCLGVSDPADGLVDWQTAMEFVAGLFDNPATSEVAAHDCGLSDGSSPGEWRLPSVEEWEAMMADAVALGCVDGNLGGPAITNDLGTECWQASSGNSFSGAVSYAYWSSTSNVDEPLHAWGARVDLGVVGFGPKNVSAPGFFFPLHVWPVRGGQ